LATRVSTNASLGVMRVNGFSSEVVPGARAGSPDR